MDRSSTLVFETGIMELILGIGIAILGLLSVVIIRLSTTFFHEMGHAIPALLFTEKSVKVYIGSYGDIAGSKYISLGRLKIYFKWNILDWKLGMCQHEGTLDSTIKTILIILGGPLASLLVSLPLILNLPTLKQNEFLFFTSIVIIAAAVYDLIVNLYPFNSPILMHDGTISFNDGRSLLMVPSKSASPELVAFQKMYADKEYVKLIEQGHAAIDKDPRGRMPYDFVIESQIQLKKYDDALDSFLILKENIGLIDRDYFGIGKVYKALNNRQEAMKYFQHFRYKNYQNLELLYEVADLHFNMGNMNECEEDLRVLLNLDPQNYKGMLLYSQILISNREFDEALDILNNLEEIDPKDPMVYFQYGLVYERRNQDALAHQNYLKAESLGCDHYGLEFKIEQTRSLDG